MRAAALAVLVLGLSGCAPDGPTLLFNFDLDEALVVPDDVDELRIEATASRQEEADLCAPFARQTVIESRADLPLRLRLRRGDIYGEWVAIRVWAFRESEPVMRLETRRSWPEEGEGEVELVFEATCLEMLCDEAPGLQCLAGICQNGLPSTLFDTDDEAEECELR